MAKGEAEPLMSPAEMKPLLLLSKKQPVNCAIGLTKDKAGVILLDKKAKPRKMLALMKKKAATAKMELDTASCRYGTAVVDTETDSQLVQFLVNKDASGAMRPKLLELLKKAGFGKCEIRVESSLDAQDDDDDEDGADDQDKAAAPAAGPAGAGPAQDTAAPEPASADAGAPTASGDANGAAAAGAADAGTPDTAQGADDGQGAGALDAGAITKRLTGLVKQMLGVLGGNPAGADAMKTAAMAGQKALKSGDLDTANQSADTLERMLGAMGGGGAQAGGVGGAAPNGAAPEWRSDGRRTRRRCRWRCRRRCHRRRPHTEERPRQPGLRQGPRHLGRHPQEGRIRAGKTA